MTMTAAELVASKKHILLDFDGPICAAFAGYGAANISRQLATLMAMEGVVVPAKLFDSPDPFELLRYASTPGDPALLADVNAEFRRLEVQAVRFAPLTPDSREVVQRLANGGHSISIVSNNSAQAVERYARIHQLTGFLAGINARCVDDPSFLKPNPHLLLDALRDRCATAGDAVMIGDSASDIRAAQAAKVSSVAFVNRPTKRQRLLQSHPDAVITEMRQLLF